MKRSMIVLATLLFLVPSCVSSQLPNQSYKPQEVVVTVKTTDSAKLVEDKVQRSMEVSNSELQFSMYTKIYNDTAYISSTGIHSWSAESMWSDLQLIRLKGIKNITMYLNNPGGSAFHGFGITDQLRLLKKSGIKVTAEASGIVASAAIPVLLICDHRVASKSTIFLIHPASIFKMFSSETLKDIESQADMLKLARSKYADIVQERSNLSRDKILELLDKDSWFDADTAFKWGMLDEVL
jgi:ATP-dependent protease ClpP protease subunit